MESHFYKLKHKLGYQRRRPATRITALGGADTSGSSAICESDRSVKILPDIPLALAVDHWKLSLGPGILEPWHATPHFNLVSFHSSFLI